MGIGNLIPINFIFAVTILVMAIILPFQLGAWGMSQVGGALDKGWQAGKKAIGGGLMNRAKSYAGAVDAAAHDQDVAVLVLLQAVYCRHVVSGRWK